MVTGQGVVTSLGSNVDEFYSNLLAGKSGVSMIEGWDTSAWTGQWEGPKWEGRAICPCQP